MRYSIWCNGVLIGHSDLRSSDPGMAVAYGPFTPAPDYEEFRAVFRRRTDAEPETGRIDEAAVASSHEQLARLRFEIRDDANAIVETGWVEIRDFSVESGDYEVSAHIPVASWFS